MDVNFLMNVKSEFWTKAVKLPKPLIFGNTTLPGLALCLFRLRLAEPVVVLTYAETRAKEISNYLNALEIENSHLHIPKVRSDFLELARILLSPDPKRILILAGEEADGGALPKNFGLFTRIYKTQETLKIPELCKQLVNLGYEQEDKVFSPGTFAQRGGVVDIFPVEAVLPIRLEFFGNTIERMYRFNPVTGNKLKEEKKLSLHPWNTFWDQSFSDYFLKANHTIVVDEPQLIKISKKKELIKKASVIFEALPNKKLDLDIQTLPNFNFDLKKTFQALNEYSDLGYQIILDSKEAKEIIDSFAEENVAASKKIKLWSGRHFCQGFASKDLEIALFTDAEIFGKKEAKKVETRRSRALKDIVLGLRPQDYVIHIDHGLGKFVRVVRREDIETKLSKEYLELVYRDGDKLYVPVEFSDRLTRYVKVTEAPPRLAKLGGIEWGNTRKKVTEAARNLAKELLTLYAKREISTRPPYLPDKDWQKALEESFEYDETPDQKRAIEKILTSMEEGEHPLDYLITADVGYGKTEVAIRAAVKAVVSGRQVAFLAPTTILAEQHFVTLQKRLKNLPIELGILSRISANEKETLNKLKEGKIDIIVGTHRLLSQGVQFKNLGLLIIDEEQRFGVLQKEKMRKMREYLDVIAMTATPIPRTLYISLSGLREIITISTPPQERLPIKSYVEPASDELIKKALKQELSRQGQVYFLHNNVMTIELAAREVQKLAGKRAKVAVAHGQLPAEKLVKTMKEFAEGKIDILVCSTIIENGLDLPNVNTLIVENADDFGLAQLHQLRGRIGRGSREAYAYFLYNASKLKKDALLRLQMIAQTQKLGAGYEIALRDLELRGAGNLLGREQHGNLVAVGLSLYSRLLEEAIYELKTGEKVALYETQINLPMPAYIPEEYIKNNEERIKTYQLLAAATDEEDLEEEFERLSKKFGELPPEVENLKKVIFLKLLATQKSLVSLKVRELTTPYGEKKWKLFIVFEQITPNITRELLRLSPDWQISELQAKIDLSKLGKDWFLSLISLLKRI